MQKLLENVEDYRSYISSKTVASTDENVFNMLESYANSLNQSLNNSNDKLVNIANLAVELERIKPTLQKQEVLVKADEKVKSSVIMDIMDAAQEAQYKKLVVAGEPLTKKAQRALENENKKIEQAEEALEN